MTISSGSAGLGDSVEIRMPEIEARTMEEWLALFPNCPGCGKKMLPTRRSWAGGYKPPKLACPDKTCKMFLKGGLKENEW